MSVFDERALQCDPTELQLMMRHLGTVHDEVSSLAEGWRGLGWQYSVDHDGNDIDVVVQTCVATADALASLLAGLDEVKGSLYNASKALAEMETDSDLLWQQAGELTLRDRAEDEADALAMRFDQIRAAEETIFRSLEAAVVDASRGLAVEIDTARVQEVIGRLIDQPGSSEIQALLVHTLALAHDYEGDGAFDLSKQELQRQQEQFLELLAIPGTTYEVASVLTFDGDPAFVGLVIETVSAPGAEHPSVEGLLRHLDASMEAGRSPEEAALPAGLFPPAYAEIKELEAERLDLNSRGQGYDRQRPWEIQGRIAELAAELGIQDGTRKMKRVELTSGATAAALISHAGAGQLWSTWFAEDWNAPGAPRDVADLELMAPHLAASEANALGFYNELGAEGAASLVYSYEPGTRPTYTLLGDALGMAASSGNLEFTGSDYMLSTTNGGELPVSTYPLQLLAVTDEIPNDFLAGASAEILRASASRGIGPIEGGPYAEEPGPGAPGLYGDPGDDPRLIALHMVSDREPETMQLLLDDLGREHADQVLRFSDGPHAFRPTYWNDDQLGASLILAASPHASGDSAAAERSAELLLHAAGNPALGHEERLPLASAIAVEEILIERPTVMVQSELGVESLAGWGLPHGQLEEGVDAATVDRALANVFLSGGGDALARYQDTALLEAVGWTLEQVDAGLMVEAIDPTWVGEIDGRIEEARRDHDLVEAQRRDAYNGMVWSIADSVTGSGIGTGAALKVTGKTGGFVAGVLIDQGVGQGVEWLDGGTNFLETDHEIGQLTRELELATDDDRLLKARVLAALDEHERLVLPDGLGVVEFMVEQRVSREAVILNPSGEPSQMTAFDWDAWKSRYGEGIDIGDGDASSSQVKSEVDAVREASEQRD